MIVVNFGHPLTVEQQTQIEHLAGTAIERVIDVPTQFDDAEPFAPQVARLVEAAGLTPADWQTLPLLVNLPSYGPVVAVLLAQLHGMIGHFPSVVRLAPQRNTVSPAFNVAEIVSLQTVREEGRLQR